MDTNNLKQTVMLASLNLSAWTGRAFDNKATSEIESTFSVLGSGRFNKKLMPSDPIEFKNINTLLSEIRNNYYKSTLVYQDLKVRLLPVNMYMEWTAQLRKDQLELERLCSLFYSAYPRIKEDSRNLLGDLFVGSDYPSIDELREKFGVKFNVLPFPDAENFGVDLPDAELTEIKDKINFTIEQSVKSACNDLNQRLYGATYHLAERLNSDGRLHASAIENLKEIINYLPKLNITNDQKLIELANLASKELTVFDSKALSSNHKVRNEIGAKAADIAQTMSGYFDIPFDAESLYKDTAEKNQTPFFNFY